MRIFLCGHELGLGFVVGRRLLEEGHKVTMLPSLTSETLRAYLALYLASPQYSW